METKTERSGLTLAAILDTALLMAARDGLDSLTIGEVAKRLGLSKSGVFSRVGSREAERNRCSRSGGSAGSWWTRQSASRSSGAWTSSRRTRRRRRTEVNPLGARDERARGRD